MAILSGNLGQGGSEKQAVYLARALRGAGATVKVYHMRPGEFHEPILRALGFDMHCLGARSGNPFLRLRAFVSDLRRFRPQVIQSMHFWANFYVGIAGRLTGTVSIGALRATLPRDLEDFSPWGWWLMRLPRYVVANSLSAKRAADARGFPPARTMVLPNVIDLEEFPVRGAAGARSDAGAVVAAVGRMVPSKRFDRFLRALAMARHREPGLTGLLIGDGPERAGLERLAESLGLVPEGVRFAGRSDDVPARLSRADVLVLSSDDEGFPNVILEGMAAGLPVVTTPAGDAAVVVQDGVTGFVVAFEDEGAMVERLLRLAASPDLRRRLGTQGRREVESRYSLDTLGGRAIDLYREMARLGSNRTLRRVLAS